MAPTSRAGPKKKSLAMQKKSKKEKNGQKKNMPPTGVKSKIPWVFGFCGLFGVPRKKNTVGKTPGNWGT